MKELLTGEYILYYHPNCSASKKQFNDLKIPKSYGKDCSKGHCPHITAFPTWHNTVNGIIYEGYIKPKDIHKKLRKKRIVSYMKSRFGNTDKALINCNGNRGGNDTGPKSMDDLLGKFGSPPLERPYGPRNNMNMQSLHFAGSTLNPLPLSFPYSLGQFGSQRNKKFGATPGTPEWRGNGTVAAEGPIIFFEGPSGGMQNLANVPMQYTNNELNRPSLGFGLDLGQMAGRNNVGHQPNIPTYYAGGNTINFQTGLPYRPYRPEQCPTISVKPDSGWISEGQNVADVSGIANFARTYMNKGLSFSKSRKKKKTRFGNMAGPQILVNTLPARLTNEQVNGASYANFGKKYYAKITLRPNNRVSIKKKKILPIGNGNIRARRSARSIRLSKMGL